MCKPIWVSNGSQKRLYQYGFHTHVSVVKFVWKIVVINLLVLLFSWLFYMVYLCLDMIKNGLVCYGPLCLNRSVKNWAIQMSLTKQKAHCMDYLSFEPFIFGSNGWDGADHSGPVYYWSFQYLWNLFHRASFESLFAFLAYFPSTTNLPSHALWTISKFDPLKKEPHDDRHLKLLHAC